MTSKPARCSSMQGSQAGDRYVEFGCGLGYVTRWATSVGADALGIDLSADQIAEATELAEGKTEFRVGSVYDHGLPPESFRRLVLALAAHAPEPAGRRHAQHLRSAKPGGLMVCEEADMSAIYAEPPSGYHEYVELDLRHRCRAGRGLCRRSPSAPVGERGRIRRPPHRRVSPALPHGRAQGVLELDVSREPEPTSSRRAR